MPSRLRCACLLSASIALAAPAALAAADDDLPTVLVGRIEPLDPTSAGLAGLLESGLEQELAPLANLHLLPREECLTIGDVSAADYLESCPVGQAEGCTLVVAQVDGADYAPAGTVAAEEGGAHVVIAIVDAEGLSVPVRLDARLGPDSERAFVRALARLIGEVERGEHATVDLREKPGNSGGDEHAALLARLRLQIDELEEEQPNLRLDLEEALQRDQRPRLTAAQVQTLRESDWVAFRDVGLPPDEYLAWWNSQEPLDRWRAQARGRKGQVILRPGAWVLAGPVVGSYRGAQVIDPATHQDSAIYAWQAMAAGVGGGAGLSVGYGLRPELEVGGSVDAVLAPYRAVFTERLSGEDGAPWEGTEEGQNAVLVVGLDLRWVPHPHRALRPVLSAGPVWWHGSAVDTRGFDVPGDLPVFPAPNLFGLRAEAGAELRLAPWLDLVADVPVMVVWGRATAVDGSASDDLVDETGPGAFLPVAVGLRLGLQIRIGGPLPPG